MRTNFKVLESNVCVSSVSTDPCSALVFAHKIDQLDEILPGQKARSVTRVYFTGVVVLLLL